MSVMSCFVDNGISSKKIRVYGLGPEHPVSSNSSDAGRSINSRVEITLAGKLPAGVSEKVQGIGQEKTGTPPVYRYKGYDIPFEEK
jgi:hypothetical protein